MADRRATKILATLGPATAHEEGISSLLHAGADVFRLNFSHGSHEDHAKTIKLIRQLEESLDRPIGIMADLQGPKLRVGTIKEGTRLEKGQTFLLQLEKIVGDQSSACLPHPEIYEVIQPGHRLLIDDGRIILKVNKADQASITTEVEIGGPLSSNKGVNIPDVKLPIPALTPKDKNDLSFALSQEIDFFALSFVQSAQDIIDLRSVAGQDIRIIAKMEKPAAMDDLENIIKEADGVMVARGDLGVELSPDQVPVAQRKIIAKCRSYGKPVVIATQMLESMIHAPTPTRAEASDVANAVYAGVDAVMLSAETAAGSYPVEAVKMMDAIIRRVESEILQEAPIAKITESTPIQFAVSHSVRELASSLKCRKIATFTTTGSTAIAISRERPEANILGLTAQTKTARFLNLVWGVQSVCTQDASTFDEMTNIVKSTVQERSLAQSGETFIITAGVPFGTPGSTNVIRVECID